jgi:hypothetical protein
VIYWLLRTRQVLGLSAVRGNQEAVDGRPAIDLRTGEIMFPRTGVSPVALAAWMEPATIMAALARDIDATTDGRDNGEGPGREGARTGSGVAGSQARRRSVDRGGRRDDPAPSRRRSGRDSWRRRRQDGHPRGVNEFRRGSLRSSPSGPTREVTVRAGSRIQDGAMMSEKDLLAICILVLAAILVVQI